MIRKLWNWLEARNQAYSFLACLCGCIYLYTLISPAFEPWRTTITNLFILGFTIFLAKEAMKSVKRMMFWLMVMPFVTSLSLLAYLESTWQDITSNFSIAIIVIFVATVVWVGTALCFNAEMTRRAMSILNDGVRYALGLALVANWYQYSEESLIAELARHVAIAPGAIIEAGVKILTLPYVLAGIAGMLILNLRQWKFIPW